MPISQCKKCGNDVKHAPSRPRVYCSKECSYPRVEAKGSTWLGKNGYLYIQHGRKGKKRLLHRVIAGAIEGQVVHHKDENKLNNDPANLEILEGGQSQHIRMHNPVLSRWAKER